MNASRLEQAARNNAVWCNTLCSAHDAPGEFLAEAWLNRHRAPAFYPNLVTLRPLSDSTPVLGNIRDLIGHLSGSWAVKDSFQNLNLSELNFDRLFEASWIWHASLLPGTSGQNNPLRWSRVTSDEELKLWEATWAKANGAHDASLKFPPLLLTDRTLAIFAGYLGPQLIAGGIANTSDEVVGLSNVFSPPDQAAPVWASLLASIQTVFPAKPVVGYEHGPSLEIALRSGFEVLGPLTVWLKRG